MVATNGPGVSRANELEELAVVRAERDALRIELEAKQKRRRGGRGRRVLAAVLVLLSCLAFTAAVPAVWTRRTLSNTDRFVGTVAPIIEHDSVTDSLSQRISAEIITLVDPESLAASALPPRARALAPPVANAVEGFIEDRVNEVIASDRFAQFWANANRFIHTQIQRVLRGEGETLTTRDGQIVIYRADKLEAVRNAVQTFHRAIFLVVALTILLVAAALLVSRARRRTLLQLSAGMLVGLVIVRRSVMYAQDEIVDLAKPENRDTAQAIVDDLMRGLFSLTQSVMIVLLLVIATALVTGPYGWAVSLRRRCAALLSAIVQSAQGASRDEATVAWVLSHRDALRFGGVIAAVLLLLVVDLSWVGFFVLVGLVVLYELALSRFADEAPRPSGVQT